MASFESNQQAYYTNEINRALPTKSSLSNDALRLALGDIDPIMPGENRRQQEASSFLSKFETTNNLALRDSQCRTYAFPNQAMRDPQARTGCGWWYTTDSNRPSVAAYGSRNGPMNSMMDVQYGNGEWIWNIGDAQQKESQRATAKVKVCKDLDYFKQQTPNIGWCATMNSAIMTDGNGNPAYPNSPGGYCPPGEKIAMTSADCPVPQPQSSSAQNNPYSSPAPAPVSISSLCAPDANGALTPACLKSLTLKHCSPVGSLAAAFANGYPNTSQDFMEINAYLTERTFTLNSGLLNDGRVSEQEALRSIMGLKQYADPNSNNSTAAAMNMCYGSPFNPCNIPTSKPPPHDIKCIKKTALEMGYSPNGRLLQTTSNDWRLFPTWGDVLAKLKWWKDVADKGPAFFGGPSDQKTAIENVYSVEVLFPTSPDCSPSLFPGLILWFDAADTTTIVRNGTLVTKWLNKSKNGTSATANSGVTWSSTGSGNGKPAMLFKNSQWLTGSVTHNGNSVTTFCVFNVNNNSRATARILSLGKLSSSAYSNDSDFNNNENFCVLRLGENKFTQLRNGSFPNNSITLDSVQMSTSWIDGAYSNIAINGNSPSTVGANGPFNINGFSIGSNISTNDSNGLLYGSVSEIIVFNVALSNTQRQQVEGYLAWKWGIQNLLSSSHPFSKIAP